MSLDQDQMGRIDPTQPTIRQSTRLRPRVMTKIAVRPIRATDIEGFHACLDSVARERKYLAQLEAPPLERTSEWLLQEIDRGVVRLVAADGERIVGWCDIAASDREGFRHLGRLGMGASKGYRGRGIGDRLLSRAVQAARVQGLEKVELDVYASNTAPIKLYEKHGFDHEGRRRWARKLDGLYDDMILMGLMLVD